MGSELPNQIQLLKDDLAEISILSLNEKKIHLEVASKPLLRMIFQSLSQISNEIPDNETSNLAGFLVEYLDLDNYISVEASMCLYRLQTKNANMNTFLEEKIDNLIDLQSSKFDKYQIFKILSQLFTFDSELSSAIFTKKASFITLLTNEVTLISNDFNQLNPESIRQLNTLLVLFSHACVEEISRSTIASMYINLILKCLALSTDATVAQSKCYAATVSVKLWKMIKPEVLENNSELLSLSNLLDINLTSLFKGLETSVECLSLLCTNVQIRQKVRNEKVLDTLFELIKDKEHTKYGIIAILSLLTLPNRLFKVQQQSITMLKDSSSINSIDINTNQKMNASKLEDNAQSIQLVVKEIVKRKFVSEYLVAIFKSMESSKGLIGECIRLMYNVIFPDIDVTENGSDIKKDEESHKVYIKEMTQILKLLTAYLIGTSQNMKYNHNTFNKIVDDTVEMSEADLEMRSIAIKALSSPEISANVEEIFDEDKEEFALSLVPFILEILVQHDIDLGSAHESKVTPFKSLKKQIFSSFDVYYAFISLAAIASLGYEKVKQSVFTLGFDSIMNALNNNNDKLQFAALQLLNEICDLSLCIAKFFNWENEKHDYYQNFSILCYLALSTNYDSQCLALQIFYTVSCFEIVAEKLAASELFCSHLNKILQTQATDDALTYYALLVLGNIIPLKKVVSNNYLHIFDESKDIILKHVSSSNEQISDCANLVAASL